MKLNILHLEDDLRDIDAVQAELRRAGMPAEFTVAHNREEFMTALNGERYDVALSDNNVAGLEGAAALKLLRAKWPELPFFFVSGRADELAGRERLMTTGATDCLGKSHLDRLPGLLRQCLGEVAGEKASPASDWYVQAMERLVGVVRELSLARDLDRVTAIVRTAARQLTGADGATFVLREGDKCHYADEDAIEPLWKGKRFPMSACISGWVMMNREVAILEDIYKDARIPADAYRPTFVKSLVMVPIRTSAPVGAIGTYWAKNRTPRPEEVRLLQALADSTSVALENVQLYVSLEQKVADRTARLEMLNKELDAFTHSVSHDLRAPLRHVSGYAEILQEEAKETLTPALQKRVASIKEAAGRMNTLISDLLQFSRMGRAELTHQAVDMNSLVREVRCELASDIGARVVNWEVAELPTVQGDRAMLKQVWANLLSNAVKYTRKRAEANIVVSAERKGKDWEFSVRDNGAGFDMRYAERLFGVFERLHGANEFEGTGVGLANVRRIITRHGGRTLANAELDKGATFYFALPAAGPVEMA